MIEHTPHPWPYVHFQPRELASPDTGQALMQSTFMYRLDFLRASWGRSIFVTSGYRSPAHNKKVGGVDRSPHLLGRAIDFTITPDLVPDFIVLARGFGFTGFGIGRGWMHIDDLDGSDRSRPSLWTY